MDTLPPVVDAIRAQRADFAFEIVAVDSSSTDGSEAFLRTGVDRFVSIPAAMFNHGLTRNLGVQYARGEFVVMLVQDAEPGSERWLHELVQPLIADSTVAGAFARQQPRDGASALTLEYASRWIAATREPRLVSVTAHDYQRLAPSARLEACAFDNVCSCIRRGVWLQHPFRATTIAEDLEWAREVLLAGWRIAYVPSAVVLHSHDRSVAYELARTRAAHQRLAALFDLQTIPTIALLARAIGSSIPLHVRRALSDLVSPSRVLRALGLAVAWPLGQYLGGRDDRLERSVSPSRVGEARIRGGGSTLPSRAAGISTEDDR
jgi:rhamnosyltransferase